MANQPLTYEVRNRVAWINWDDGRANTLTNETFATLFEFFDAAEHDEAVGSVVLAGREGFFSAGMDLKWMPTCTREELGEIGPNMAKISHRMFIFPKPIIAAVTGHCVAGGAILLLACDRSVAATGEYNIGLNEVALGVPFGGFALELAKAHLAPAAYGPGPLQGGFFQPQRALEVGFVDELAAPDQVLARAGEIAATAAELSHFSYFATKQALRGEGAEVIREQAESGVLVPLFQVLADIREQAEQAV
ncbi:MAG: crotonase/enoyl-CoA hydratase family protein [Thermoleophilaceae bacterium]|nr:crotonase/enoyl-CoA hydratase family protein [Thermoleophilaceae bacterium]